MKKAAFESSMIIKLIIMLIIIAAVIGIFGPKLYNAAKQSVGSLSPDSSLNDCEKQKGRCMHEGAPCDTGFIVNNQIICPNADDGDKQVCCAPK